MIVIILRENIFEKLLTLFVKVFMGLFSKYLVLVHFQIYFSLTKFPAVW